MGSRGPIGRPANVSEFMGARPYRVRQATPASAKPGMTGTAPKMPSWLKKDREAAAEWRRVVPELERRGVVCALDAMALAMYCSAWSHLQACQKVLTEQGTTYETKRGVVHPRPEVRQAQQWSQLLLNSARELGLSPTARRRMHLPDQHEDPKASPWDELDALIENKPQPDPRQYLADITKGGA